MMIFPAEITDSVIEPRMIIDTFTAVEDPEFVSMLVLQELNNLNLLNY